MQIIEDEKSSLTHLATAYGDIEAEMRTLLATRDAALAEIDQTLTSYATQRATLVTKIPTDLMALYTKIAERQDTAAALLRARRCTGCGLLLDASALSRIANAAPAEVVRCEECGRILVRTPESGL
jgi:predicted  nucleic acid-binding Zn-ribbon protein